MVGKNFRTTGWFPLSCSVDPTAHAESNSIDKLVGTETSELFGRKFGENQAERIVHQVRRLPFGRVQIQVCLPEPSEGRMTVVS